MAFPKHKEKKPISCPKFGKVLKSCNLVQTINGKEHHFIKIFPTFRTEIQRALTTSGGIGAAGFLIMLAIYLPEYVFNYSNRGENFIKFFFIYLGALMLLMILIGFIKVIMTNRTVYIDEKSKRIIFAKHINDTTWEKKGIDFSEISCIEPMPTNSMFGTSKVAVLANGEYYIVADAKRFQGELESLSEWLKYIVGDGKL